MRKLSKVTPAGIEIGSVKAAPPKRKALHTLILQGLSPCAADRNTAEANPTYAPVGHPSLVTEFWAPHTLKSSDDSAEKQFGSIEDAGDRWSR